MTEAVIVSTARTPLCKSWRGAFNMTHGAALGAHAVRHAISRAGIDPAEVEDVIMGCANPEGATGGNIARQIALRAGLPVTTAGVTVNRFCSSGLQSIAMAAQRVIVCRPEEQKDRKSTRLNSSHGYISYAVFCLKKKKKKSQQHTVPNKTQYQRDV